MAYNKDSKKTKQQPLWPTNKYMFTTLTQSLFIGKIGMFDYSAIHCFKALLHLAENCLADGDAQKLNRTPSDAATAVIVATVAIADSS